MNEEIKNKDTNKKEKKKIHLFSKLFSILIWIVVLCWAIVIGIDYYRAYNKKDPEFCLDKTTKEYDDGTVTICKGLGYKVIQYKRTSFNAIEFGPFWISEKNTNE